MDFYTDLCNMLIRPTRQLYHLYDLGTFLSHSKEILFLAPMENAMTFKFFLAIIPNSNAAITTLSNLITTIADIYQPSSTFIVWTARDSNVSMV